MFRRQPLAWLILTAAFYQERAPGGQGADFLPPWQGDAAPSTRERQRVIGGQGD